MNKHYIIILAASISIFFAADISEISGKQDNGKGSSLSDKIRKEFRVKKYSMLELDIPLDLPKEYLIETEHEGVVQTIWLERCSLRSKNFKAVRYNNGKYEEFIPAQSRTYRGYVLEEPDSIVAATFGKDGLTAQVMHRSGKSHWKIKPLRKIRKSASRQGHIVYSSADEEPLPGMCGVEEIAPHEEHIPSENTIASAVESTPNEYLEPAQALAEQAVEMEQSTENCQVAIAQIAFDMDNGIFSRYTDLQDALDRVDQIVNILSVTYLRDAKITYELTGVIIRETPFYDFEAGGKSNGDILGEFKTKWNQNLAGNDGIVCDLAHLITSHNTSGVLGLAWVGSVCGYNKYAWSADSVGVISHETGHNWGLGHCDGNGDCHIMCSGYGGCNGNPSFFGDTGAKYLRSRAPQYGCVPTIAAPAGPAVPPRAFSESATVEAGKVRYIDVLQNDIDGNCDELSIVDYDISTLFGSKVGLVEIDGRPMIRYIAPEFLDANLSFNYVISDPGGQEDTGTVNIAVVSPFGEPAANGLQLWLDANIGVSVDGQNYVTQWADQSGNNNDVNSISQSRAPIYEPAGFHGLPTVKFDGVNDYLSGGYNTLNITNDHTVFIVLKTYPKNLAAYLAIQGGSTGATGIVCYQGGQPNLKYIVKASGDWTQDYVRDSNAGWEPGVGFQASFRRSGVNMVLRAKGSQIGWDTGTAGPVEFTATSELMIGIQGDPSQLAYSHNGAISEILVYNRALSDSEVLKTEFYLEDKWIRHESNGHSYFRSDLNRDSVADFDDFKIFADNWLSQSQPL